MYGLVHHLLTGIRFPVIVSISHSLDIFVSVQILSELITEHSKNTTNHFHIGCVCMHYWQPASVQWRI